MNPTSEVLFYGKKKPQLLNIIYNAQETARIIL